MVAKGLDANDFLNPAKAIEGFVDELSNWYIRRSRDRFWGSGLSQDKITAYQTLHHVLLTLSKVIAPYTPLLAEDMFDNLGGGESVHLADFPQADVALIDAELERDMESAKVIVELARNVRNETSIKTRQPLSELIVSLDREFELASYEAIIKDEINVKHITVQHSDSGFVDFTLKLNLKVAGRKFGKQVAPIQQAFKELSAEQTREIVQSGLYVFTTQEGEQLDVALDEILVEKKAKSGFASASGNGITVALNTDITPELEQEGWVREVIRAVQDTRKKLDLPIEKRIDLQLHVDDELQGALQAFDSLLQENLLLQSVAFGQREDMEIVQLGDKSVGIFISR
jgi:isoleucyl-tRNA synthetase